MGVIYKRKEDVLRNFELAIIQIQGGTETFTKLGLENLAKAMKSIMEACPDKIANAVLEEVD